MKRPRNLRHLVAFDAPAEVRNGFGEVERTGWDELFETRAEIQYQGGKEEVSAATLTGSALFRVCIRAQPAARQITPEHRMRDVRQAVAYNIREVDSVTDPQWVWLRVESGTVIQ